MARAGPEKSRPALLGSRTALIRGFSQLFCNESMRDAN